MQRHNYRYSGLRTDCTDSQVCQNGITPNIKILNTTQPVTPPFAAHKWAASDHQCTRPLGRVPAPFHAQEKLLNSSSWVDQVPNFRQEIRQSNYRNDPVKYDLDVQHFGQFSNLALIINLFDKVKNNPCLWSFFYKH